MVSHFRSCKQQSGFQLLVSPFSQGSGVLTYAVRAVAPCRSLQPSCPITMHKGAHRRTPPMSVCCIQYITHGLLLSTHSSSPARILHYKTGDGWSPALATVLNTKIQIWPQRPEGLSQIGGIHLAKLQHTRSGTRICPRLACVLQPASTYLFIHTWQRLRCSLAWAVWRMCLFCSTARVVVACPRLKRSLLSKVTKTC